MNLENKNRSSFGGYHQIPSNQISELGERFSLFENGGSYLSIYKTKLYEDAEKSKSTKKDDREKRKAFNKSIKNVRSTILGLTAAVNSAVNTPATKNFPSVRDFSPKITALADRLKQIEGTYASNTDNTYLGPAIESLEKETTKVKENYDKAWQADLDAYTKTFEKREDIAKAMEILKEADEMYTQAQFELRSANYNLINASVDKKKESALPQGTAAAGGEGGNLDAKPVKTGTVDKANVKKVQEFIVNKFKGTKIGETAAYKSFAAAVPKAPGTFGPNTKKMIILLKKSMGMSDTSSDITEEFISKLGTEKIKATNESKGIVSLFKSRMIREDIDPSLFIEAEKEYGKGGSSEGKPKSSETSKPSETTKSSETTKGEEKKEEPKKEVKGTYDTEWYSKKADELYSAMAGAGTSEQKIYNIIGDLKTKTDFVLLHKAFRKRTYPDQGVGELSLHGWIVEELDMAECLKVNKMLRKLGVPETFWFKSVNPRNNKAEIPYKDATYKD